MAEPKIKPPIPTSPMQDFPRIEVDTSEDGPFDRALRVAVMTADMWALGPDGPYKKPQTPADAVRGQIREALLHLLELGVVDIDEERLNGIEWWPVARETRDDV